MKYQEHEDVLVVGLEDYVTDNHRGRLDAHLEKVGRLIVVLQCQINHAAVVVVEQKVLCVELAGLLAHPSDVDVEELEGWLEALGQQAKLAQVRVNCRQLAVVELYLAYCLSQDLDSSHWLLKADQRLREQVAELGVCESQVSIVVVFINNNKKNSHVSK